MLYTEHNSWPHNVHSTIWKLSSPDEMSNCDNWSFAVRMMRRVKNLEYVIEGRFKEGFNGATTVLPEAILKANNRLVSLIITCCVHE